MEFLTEMCILSFSFVEHMTSSDYSWYV